LAEGTGQARILEGVRHRVTTVLKKTLLNRPVIKAVVEEYVLEASPMVNNYVKKIAQITGLPEDVVKRSTPVRNLVKKIIGE